MLDFYVNFRPKEDGLSACRPVWLCVAWVAGYGLR